MLPITFSFIKSEEMDCISISAQIKPFDYGSNSMNKEE